MAASFPLLVEGSWGPDPPKNLSNKLQLYFQSRKKSGGGECEVRQEPGNPARFVVLFSPEDVRQNVLEKTDHELVWPGKGTFKLTVQLPTAADEALVSEEKTPENESKTTEDIKEPDVSEELDPKLSVTSSLEKVEDIPEEHGNTPYRVVFENLPANVTDMMLILLVENISGLSSDDFQVEIIQDFNIAVVTFQIHIGMLKFVDDCMRHHTIRQLQLSPRLLEMTRIIRVENLPPGIDDYQLQLFFENPHNGGGRVAHVECFPEESAALIEFYDIQVLDTILAKKHNFKKMPLFVFPYYTSLGTALYGKEKPLIKLPAPFQESLDLPLWNFFQKKNHLIKEINDEMRRCHCELTWSQLNNKVTIRPAATLVNQGRHKIKTWKEDASAALSGIRSKYKVTSFKVDPVVWDNIKKNLEEDNVLIEFDTQKEIVSLAGKAEDVQNIELQIKELIERTTEKMKKEEQSLKEEIAISSGKYFLLEHSGVLQCLLEECQEMEICYDAATQKLCLNGFYADVYKAKCEIQEKVYTMVHKNVQVSPEVFQFLQQVDAEEFSKSLFIVQKILAVYQIEGTTVLLTSFSSKVLVEAEEQMLHALNCKHIEVEDKEILNDKRWKGITGKLKKQHNSSAKIVTVSELTSESSGDIIIAGCVREVNEIYSMLFDFLEKHMKVERSVEIKSSLIVNYLKAEKLFSKKIKKGSVKLVCNLESKPNNVSLIGFKRDVVEGVNLVKQIQDLVFVKEVFIDKPGARHFFQEKERLYKSEVKRKFGCFIELQESEEQEGGITRGEKCFLWRGVAPGVTLTVQQGDLAQFPVDVVVHASNEDLKHSGALSAVVQKAVEPKLQGASDQRVKGEDGAPPGNVTISAAENLPCSHIIYAVGPRWKEEDAPRCVQLLRNVVGRSLLLAERKKYRSIAIPAISSGGFGFPLQKCVETIVSTIKENIQHKPDGCTLKEIYLVDPSEKTTEAFVKAVKTMFKDITPDVVSLPDATSSLSVPAAVQPVRMSEKQLCLVSPEGLKILLVREGVQNAKTHVIVNSIPSDLGLNRGPLSQALLKEAGPKLQEELTAAGQRVTVNVGTVLKTSGCRLPCNYVLHVVAPQWNSDTSSRKVMENIIRECLEITEKLSLQSIAFPAIGTGNLGFPKAIFAELITSEVLKFSSKNQRKTLQEVHFLLHPSDQENIQAFSDEFARKKDARLVDKIPEAEVTKGFYGTISSPDLGVHEMRIGPILFQVVSGDITKEAADVIVNSTSNTFNLKAGVSKAILECAGKNVEVECSRLAQQGNHEFIITEGGLLMCKKIIHIIGGNDVKKSVSCVLQECEKRNYSSVCLPAIGTGRAQQDPDKVAEGILDAIEDFIRKGLVQSVKKVKVVIFLPQVLDVFYANIKKREGSQDFPQPSVLSKTASYFGLSKSSHKKQNPLVLEKKIESAVFQVCGKNVSSVEKTVSWIQELIEKEQDSFTTEDECIKDFDEKEYQKLNELGKTLPIKISWSQKRIEVSGIRKHVAQARDHIDEMIKSILSAKEKEIQADCVSEFVEWQYNDSNTFQPFDKMTNLKLEDARRTKKEYVNIRINNQQYRVNLKANTAKGPNGHEITIKRLSKSSDDLPAHWSDMQQQNFRVVELQSSDPEYSTVASMFKQTCSQFVIEKIERIQNPNLWICYQAKKKAMDTKNGQTINEKKLFHGTDADSVPHVNRNGFNRSYAGKNAIVYGKGTYFAVNADYSAHDQYSKPDGNGKKHMYYVRVLTGIYTRGNSSLIVPPSKNPQNPTDLYDTVTDNVQNPTIFVVFYDYQAYPEYLITFRR